MTRDTLILCNDLVAFKELLRENGLFDEESQTYTTGSTITPIVYDEDNKSLSYTRNFNLSLEDYLMLEDLGDYEQMKANPDALAKYKSVYDYDQTIELEDNTIIKVPFEIGRFA